MYMAAHKFSVLCIGMGVLLLQSATASNPTLAGVVTLEPSNMGYYWYEKDSWMGGSNTSTGFSYGDAGGVQHVQTNYQYYGGADRSWQQKDLYFQIDLRSITNDLDEAALHFFVTADASPVPSILKHVSIQSALATGDAAQKMAGEADVAGTDSFSLGWNSLDVTTFLQSDLDNGYSFAAFSIPKFSQAQDQNRLLSMYGPSSTTLEEGESTQPYLAYTIPEPGTMMLLALAGGVLGLFARNRRQRG